MIYSFYPLREMINTNHHIPFLSTASWRTNQILVPYPIFFYCFNHAVSYIKNFESISKSYITMFTIFYDIIHYGSPFIFKSEIETNATDEPCPSQ